MIKLILKNKKLVFLMILVIIGVVLYKDHMKKKSIEGFNAGDKVTLMYFSATWCGHCQDFKPTWEKLQKYVKNNSDDFASSVKLINYDSDRDTKQFEKYNVKQFPTLILLKDDGSTIKFEENRDLETLKSFIFENS